MANFQIIPQTRNAAGAFVDSPINSVVGTEIKFYINGRTTLTKIREEILNGSDISIIYEFDKVGFAMQGTISLLISNDKGTIDSNYVALRDGTWLIDIDSTEYFRGTPDKSSFTFNRQDRTVSLILGTGKVDDNTLTQSITTSFPQPTVAEIIADYFDQLFSITTTNFDVDFAYPVDAKNAYIDDADAGAQDVVITSTETSPTLKVENRFKQFVAQFALNFAIWKGEGHVWFKNNFFSNTVTVSLTDSTTLSVIENLDYKQEDFFNQAVMDIHRWDTSFNFKKDKRFLRANDSEVIDYESLSFIPWWKTHSMGNWSGTGWAQISQVISGTTEYWATLQVRNNLATSTEYIISVTPTETLDVGDKIRVSLDYMNFTGAERLWFKVGTAAEYTPYDIEIEVSTSTLINTVERGNSLVFEYEVVITGDIFIKLISTDMWSNQESAFNINRIVKDEATAQFRWFSRGDHDMNVGAGVEKYEIRGASSDFDGSESTTFLDGVFTSDSDLIGGGSFNTEIGTDALVIVNNPGSTTNSVSFSEVAVDKANADFANSNNERHRLSVGDTIIVEGTTNYNGQFDILSIINVTTVQFARTEIGSGTEAGEAFKKSLDKDFWFRHFQSYKITNGNSTTVVDYDGNFNVNDNPRLEPYKKGTGAGFLDYTFIDELNIAILKKSLEIYEDRNNTEFVRKASMSLNLTTINPWTRISFDSVFFLIERFKFNLRTGVTDLDLIEA